MTLLEGVAVLAAGFGAGAINTVVGAGTLITFSTLVALGYAPVVANVSNTVGLVSGSFGGAFGYRHELVGQGARVLRLSAAAVLGGLTGAALLLVLPPAAFRAIVPVLIGLGCLLVLFQPRITRSLAREHAHGHNGGPLLFLGIYATSVYGGYFGAAQGVLHIALIAILTGETLQRTNAAKNVISALVNLAAAVFFIVLAQVDWAVALLLAVGSTLGAFVGARYGRRLPDRALRWVIVAAGTVAVVRIVTA